MRTREMIGVCVAMVALAGGLYVAQRLSEDDAMTLTAMTFNVWGAGGNEGKPIDDTVAAIEAADPDIIGIQETRLETGHICTAKVCPPGGKSVAPELAKALGYHYYDQTERNAALWASAILSKYPIEHATPHDLGVEIDADGHSVYAFNIHLEDDPYGPYQVLGIPYGGAPFVDTEAQAIKYAKKARGPAIALLREDVAEAEGADAAFVFGDFNEPSVNDWTASAVEAGQQPLEVAWPTTAAIEKLGFVDALRAVYPDPVKKPAFTWTPTSDPDDPNDHHDRIDFVFARADDLSVTDAAIVGEKHPEADIVSRPWPSDHRAVVATVEF